jgi:Leucine-rich repeat (LRR) protein
MAHRLRLLRITYPFLLALFLVVPGTPAHGQVLAQDSLALVDLYNSTNGPGWQNVSGWISAPIDVWTGVTISGGRVTGLNLLNKNLSGSLPASIGDLTALTTLWLGGDNISGSLPSTIGNLTNLTGLYIYLTNLSGAIPPEIGDMTSLYAVLLESNNLSGAIPAEIGNLTNLYTLKLYDNNLSGSIPEQIGSMSNLGILDLNNNNLSGSIPAEIGNLANLRELSLWGNQFSGAIPSAIGNLGSLKKLYLNQNQLTGTIPDEIGGLVNLEVLSLGGNQITGTLPTQIGSLTKLSFLRLASGQFSGAIPATITNCTKLNQIYIQDNQFDGLPDLSSLTYLANLDIENNNFTFEDIEPNLGAANNIFDYSPQNRVGHAEYISILRDSSFSLSVTVGGAHNQYQWTKNGGNISGANSDNYAVAAAQYTDAGTYQLRVTNTWATGLTIYSEPAYVSVVNEDVGEDTTATGVALQDSLALVALYNSTDGPNWVNVTGWLTGPVDTWSNLAITDGRVTVIDLSNKNLTGVLPEAINDLTELLSLRVSNNQLTGFFPPSIGNLTKMIQLNLDNNQFSGPIPASIGNLDSLLYLYLQGNQFSGPIPPEIGNLTKVINLWAYDNQLSGALPTEIGSCESLRHLNLTNNQLTGALPTELVGVPSINRIDLASNRLADLPDFSSTSSLCYLYVQNNRLTFEDILPNVGVPCYFYTYSPQDSLGAARDTSVFAGGTLELTLSTGGTGNAYQWLKDGGAMAGADNDTLAISTVNTAHTGVYTCEITNIGAPDLTLYSRPINVSVVVDTTAPVAPQNLIAVLDEITVTLTWNRIEDPDFLQYRIYGGTAANPTTVAELTSTTDGSGDTGRVFTNLARGATYYYRVTAVDKALNESEFSNEVNVEVINSAPTAFHLVSPGNNTTLAITDANLTDSLTIVWSVAADADGHNVRYSLWLGGDLTILPGFTGLAENFAKLAHQEIADSMTVAGMMGGITGSWAVYATDQIDTTWSDTLSLAITATLGIVEELGVPSAFALHPAYPNPFNPSTMLRFDLPEASGATLVVYDLLGREVVQLVDSYMEPGYHHTLWNGRDQLGHVLPSGIYIAYLVTPEYSSSIKLVMLK